MVVVATWFVASVESVAVPPAWAVKEELEPPGAEL